MEINYGDRVTFGKEWCDVNGLHDILGTTWKFGVVEFEYDNGLYVEDSTYPGIKFDEDCDGYSAYHLFGNDMELLMDCTIIKASDQESRLVIEEYNKKIEKESREYVEYFMKLVKDSEK